MRERIALLFVLGTLIYAPGLAATTENCATYCTESKLLHLDSGSSYQYSYSGWAETFLSPHSSKSEDHDVTGLLLNATVTLTALSPCEIMLQMSEVSISGGGGALHRAELEREPLRASLQAGRIETLCVTEDASALARWSLNVKRGILSALQVSLKSTPQHTGQLTLHESDVSGTCRTQYEYLQLEGSTLITKNKDLSLCSGRTNSQLHLDNTHASTPLLKGDQECLQTIKDGYVSMVRCRETHVLQPFSSGQHGATTRVEQVLVLENIQTDKVRKLPLTGSQRRTSLVFEQVSDDDISLPSTVEDTQVLLEQLASHTFERNTATHFAQLLRAMRTHSRDQLLQLVSNAESQLEREVLLDALPSLDTAAGAAAMTSLYVARAEQQPWLQQWLEEHAVSWFAALATSRKADTSMLSAVVVVLQELESGQVARSDAASVVLGVSGLTHALCERIGTSACAQEDAVREVVTIFERIVARNSGQSERNIILAMKGLGNLGVFFNAEATLQKYYQNTSAPIELRIAAMDALRRAPCSSVEPLLNVYTNTQDDVEVRIAAYLAAVRCPTSAVLRAVKRALYSETVNQVGSFVWTHLTNSQESTSKSRYQLRALLGNEFLQNKFRTDARQFSRNFEFSRYFESLGAGATADANIIFSTKSYLPRSAMLNLTVDLFGESINLLEVGARVQGMEPMLERLFSQRGTLENEAVAQLLRNSREDPAYDNILNKTSPLKQITVPKASSYIRLFGSEVSYLELADMMETSSKFDLSPNVLLKHLINRKEHEFSRSLELMDASQQVPTALGLPLKISMNATASVKLAVRGNFESNMQGLQISGKFAPSANVALTGFMTIGSADFIQGIKFEANAFTHTSLDTKLKISHEGKLNIQTDMPSEKQTVIEMTSQRFIFNGDKISKIPDLTPNRETYVDCTGDFADQLLGVQICSEVSYPNATLVDVAPYFPLTGDAYVNITIVKTDPTFKTYDFSTSWTYVPGVRYDFGVSYDRLGSSLLNRRRVVQAVYDRDAGVARVTLDIPEKQTEVAVSWDSKGLSAAELIATYEREVVAQVFAKMAHHVKPNNKEVKAGKYEPELSFNVKGLTNFNVKGVVNYVADTKASAELHLEGLSERPLTLGADYTRDPSTGSVDAKLSVDTPWVTWDMKSGAKLTPSSLGLRVSGSYNVSADDHHNVDLHAKYSWNTQGALKRDYLNLRAQMSQWPALSGQVTAETMTSRGYYEGALRLVLRDEEWNITQRAQSSGGGDVWLSQTVSCPRRDIDFRFEHRHKLKETSFTTTTTLHVDAAKNTLLHLDMKHIPGDGVAFSAEWSHRWPGITFSDGNAPYLRSRVHQATPGNYVAYIDAQWNEKRAPLRINVTYTDLSSLKALKHSVRANLTGALGFTSDLPLCVSAAVQAESGKAIANTSVVFGEDEKMNVQATYELEMQEKHNFLLSARLWNKKTYKVSAAIVNTDLEKRLAVELLMSRHIAFDIKVAAGSGLVSLFWDKARDPSLNVTLNFSLDSSEQGLEGQAELYFPGQRVSAQASWIRRGSVMHRQEEILILRGHEVAATLTWLPEKEIHVSGKLLGSRKNGLQMNVELRTSMQLLGETRRYIDAQFLSGSPTTVRAMYGWGEDQNVTCDVTTSKENDTLVIEMKVASTMWQRKEAKARLTHKYTHWSTMEGEVVTSWASEGLALYWGWDLSTDIRMGVRSWWSRVPTCGLEIRLDGNDEENPDVVQRWVKVYHEDQRWEAVLRQNHFDSRMSFQLDVLTPLQDLAQHAVNVTLKVTSLAISLTSWVNTPLLGDFALHADVSRGTQSVANLHVLNADTTVIKINTSLEKNGAKLSLLIPEICNCKSSLSFVRNESSMKAKFTFTNYRKLLHEFDLQYSDLHYENNSVDFTASFVGFSYLIMNSKWEMEVKHTGNVNDHISYLRINQFSLNHKFKYEDVMDWHFNLIAKTNENVLNATLDTNDTKLDYMINLSETEVLHFNGDTEEGFVNLHFMDSILQVHVTFTIEDEVKTMTKIIADSNLYATILTSSFLRFNDDCLESIIISGQLDSGSNSVILKLNMDAGVQITGDLRADYNEHKLNVNFDVLSPNNHVNFVYKYEEQEIIVFKSFLNMRDSNEISINAKYKEHTVKLQGDLKVDEEQKFLVAAKLDTSFDDSVFPVTANLKFSLAAKELQLTVLDVNKSGVSVQASVIYQPQSGVMAFEFGGTMPGFSDEFLNIVAKYQSQSGRSLVLTYEKKRYRYHGEFSMTDTLIEAKVQTPLQGYENVNLRMGVVVETPKRVVLEFSKTDYQFDAELLYTETTSNSKVIVMAKSSSGMELEGLFTKTRTQRSNDFALLVQLNGEKVEAGALLEYGNANLNITTNVTRGGETARMFADIRRTEDNKSFFVQSMFNKHTYSMYLYSNGIETEYEQGFKVEAPNFQSAFRYEKQALLSLITLELQQQSLTCKINGSVINGELESLHISPSSMSLLRLNYDFRRKIDITFYGFLNEPRREGHPLPVTIAYAQPVQLSALYHPEARKAHVDFKFKENNYLADASYIDNIDGSKLNVAVDAPYFEKTLLNVSYKFAETEKIISVHFDYGQDFYEVFSEVLLDGSYAVQLNLDIKSSLPNFERIKVIGGFKNDADFTARVNLNFPGDYYIITLNGIPNESYDARLETSSREFEVGYSINKSMHLLALKIDKKEIMNATFELIDDKLMGSIITPHEKYRNVTVYIGFGNNLPSKNIEIHRNEELLFHAHMYPVESVELKSGTGIMAILYQGDEKLVYDAQFSVNNPVYVILKQHESVNGTRDILHISLNVTDEYTATGEATILLPIAPHTRMLAKGHIQIENNNAEFRVAYKMDGEKESNFSITYHSFTDEYSIYNIITNISTPFQGYEKIALQMQSSLTETVVHFVSPFKGYESIKIVSVHRLNDNKKELQVQYQNMHNRIFYLKAMFINEPSNKVIDLEARSPMLNGQALVYTNSTHMGIRLEQDRVILTEIISQFDRQTNGYNYQFIFRKPEKEFEIQTSFKRENGIQFKFTTNIDNDATLNIDFEMSTGGHVTATLYLPEQKEYSIAGDIDFSEQSLQMSIIGNNFKTEISFAITSTGFVKIESNLLANKFEMNWEIQQFGANFSLSSGSVFDIKYLTTDSLLEFAVVIKGRVYSFTLGQIVTKGWPNVKLALIWNNEDIIDFQHQFLTDNYLTLVRTRLTSPYLGTHKNMKFDLTLKTKEILSIEVEFKWRPKDLTTFKSQLKLDMLSSLATVDFKSPFSSDFLFTAAYDFSSEVKNMEIYYHLAETVHLKAVVIPKGNDQKVNITLTSPIKGYTHVNLIGHHTIKQKLHTASLKFSREYITSEIQVIMDQQELKATISTVDTRWQISATYNLINSVHTVTSAFQWGGMNDVIRTDISYKPNALMIINIIGPDINYQIDYKTEWSNEKKAVDLLLKRNDLTAEFNIQLATKDNLYMFVAFTKSPFLDFIRVSSILDSESEELRGALQVNETVYSIHATKVEDNDYTVSLRSDNVEALHFDVSFDGDVSSGLKLQITCTTPSKIKLHFDGLLTLAERKKLLTFDISWTENLSETFSFTYFINEHDNTEIQTKINTNKLKDFETYLNYGSNFVIIHYKNESEVIKTRIDYLFTPVYSLNITVEYNEQNYGLKSYFDLNDVTTLIKLSWPQNKKIDLAITLKPGDLSLFIATPFVYLHNVHLSGKYSEEISNNLYQLTSSANAKWDEFVISLEGSIRNSKDNYGFSGTLNWGNDNTITLSCDVLQNKTLMFSLTTPFKGLPYIAAKLESLKHRHNIVTGIYGEITTPFIKLPQVNFTFNRVDNLIEAQFSFDTSTYKNVSIHTKFSSINNKYLYLHMNTPFLNQVKQIKINAKSEKLQGRIQSTKIAVYMDEKLYEMKNNYTIINNKLDCNLYLSGPKSSPIALHFGGKFIMKSFTEFDIETFVNEDFLAIKYTLIPNAMISGKIYLPSSQLWTIPAEFDLSITRESHFEGKLNYNYGGLIGNSLIKNKITNNSLETIMYLNLPRILKYPLQFELNANYVRPKLQFNGYASYMAEHRLDLTMGQNSFRTTLDAHLDSAFFKDTKKFNLALTSDTLSISLNDELQVTGLKKTHQLVLKLSQLHQKQDHTLSYSWELFNIPKFEVTLESPLLTAKKATFSATYLGLTQGVNLKLISGTESLRLDYNIIDQKISKGIKVVIGNANTQALNFAATIVKVLNGHEVIAELDVLELSYKIKFNYTLPMSKENPLLTAALKLSTPYLFPMKLLNAAVKAGRENKKYILSANVVYDTETVIISSELENNSLSVKINSSIPYVTSGVLLGNYKIIDDKNIFEAKLITNGIEVLTSNFTLLNRQHSMIVESRTTAKLPGFKELNFKLTIPSELKYSLIANIELISSEPFKMYFIVNSRPTYTNVDLAMTGLTASLHLSSNQAEFTYKTGSDDYRVRMYSKSSGHELHSEVTINNGSIELFKAGLFGMFHNHSDFYILMSIMFTYEPIQSVVFYVGGEKSQLRFGAEYEGNIDPSKQSYTATLNHHINSLVDFDLGVKIEKSQEEIFIAKLTHTVKADFYVALAQINTSILKLTTVNEDDTLLGTATLKHANFSSEMSGKLVLNPQSKGFDVKVTFYEAFYHIGGLYNISDEYFKVSFDLDSPSTSQNSLNMELAQPDILYVAVDHEQAPLLLIDIHPTKVRTKYVLLNLTDTKFMISEYSGKSYELSTSLLFQRITYRAKHEFVSEGSSYTSNTTITLPSRTVSLFRQRVKKEFHTSSEIYLSWESLSKRIGYSYDIFKDNFKTNYKVSLEIPSRALELKTHKRYMVIDDNLTDIEYGIHFNWDTKVHTTPITVVSSLKYNHAVGYLYIVLSHPAFNSTLAIDAQLRRSNTAEVHMSAQLGSVHEGVMETIATTAVNVSQNEYQVLILHPASHMHHVWRLKVMPTLLKMSLSDVINKRHVTSAVIFNNNRIDASLSCDELEIRLAGELDIDHANSRYGATLSGSYDSLSAPLSLSIAYERLDAQRMRITGDLNLAEDRGYYAEARYSPQDVSARIIQREYSVQHTALHAALILNDTQTLSVRGRYRAELWSNISLDMQEPVQRANLVTQQMLNRVRNMFSEEFIARASVLSNSMVASSTFRRIVDHTRTQWSALKQDFSAVRNLLAQLYNKDEFYIKTICQFSVNAFWQGKQALGSGMSSVVSATRTLVTKIIPELLTSVYSGTLEPLVQGLKKLAPSMARFARKITEAWKKIQTALTTSIKTSVEYARDAALSMAKFSSERMTSLRSWLNETKNTIVTEILTPWLSSLSQLARDIDQWLTQLNAEISRVPQLMEKYIMSLEETQAVLSFYQSCASWLEEINFTEIVSALRQAFKQWYTGVTEELHTYLGEHSKYITITLETMKGSYDEVMTLPTVIYARKIHDRVSQKFGWAWEHWDMDTTMQEIIIRLSDEVLAMLLEWTDWEKYDTNNADDTFHFDTMTGDFSGTFDLPFTWHRFDQAPQLQDDVQSKLEKVRFAIMDKMYHLASESGEWQDSLYRTVLPPFSASALVSVSGHVITFDGKHFKVKEQLCGSYLLAADYYENKFAVSINYGSDQGTPGPLTSVTLHTRAGHRIDLAFDTAARTREDDEGFSKIMLDGVKSELPARLDGVVLTREGQMVSALSEEGVALRCNVVAGLCSLELPGWFHGRVAGLAGSLDREPGNDFTDSNSLAQWRVSTTAGCNVKMSKVRESRSRASPTCTRLFKSSDSPLQPCFSRLDPSPFATMCELDVAAANPTEREPECQAAEAYVEQCKFVGMDISMPQDCVTCRLASGRPLAAGDVVIYDSAPGSRLPPPPSLADVVLLIERGPGCIQPSDLAELPAKLESVMRATVNSTRFALVTFGADTVPAIHTLEGQIWSTRRGIQHALNTLELEPSSEEPNDRDLLAALLATSSKLSFRAGASKSIVLAACTSCARTQDTALVFAEASSLLLEADVRLHVLQRDEMPIRRGKKRGNVHQGSLNPVMGVDSHGAYTGRRVKGTSIPLPSKAIMRQLSIPKDLCTPLALETNGTMFSAARLVRREQQDARRKWLDVWSRRVASSAAPSPCQTCDCVPYTDGSSRVTCQPCVSPAIQYFLQEWEEFLEAAVLEEVEESEDDVSMSAETLEALTSKLAQEHEEERQVLNRLRDMIVQGKLIPDGI